MLIEPGSLLQISSAFIITLIYMLLVGIAQPFKDDGDDIFAKACSFSLSALFFFSVLLKVGGLTEEIDGVLNEQLRSRFKFDSVLISVGMVTSIIGALVVASVMAARQLVEAARKPVIKLESTKSVPYLPLRSGHTWHMFLSHIWSSGQDQCATIKRQLHLLMPDASIFLDVSANGVQALTAQAPAQPCSSRVLCRRLHRWMT